KDIIGYVLGHHAPRTDYRPVADRHAWADHRTAAYPHILPYRYPPGIFQSRSPFPVIKRVRGRINLHIRAKERAAADLYLRHIEDNTVEVEKDFLPHHHVIAIIAVKRWLKPKTLDSVRNHFLQNPHPLFCLILAAVVQFLD